jgi:hypothetical protein
LSRTRPLHPRRRLSDYRGRLNRRRSSQADLGSWRRTIHTARFPSPGRRTGPGVGTGPGGTKETERPMKRSFAAGLLALPALLAAGPEAHAQYPGCAGAIPPPGCASAALPQGPCAHLGCGGFCFRFLGATHFHGPLWNYGPYTGYYPFEPYGPWNAALQYTGPRPNDCGHGCGLCGLFGKCGRHGCGLGGGCGAGGCGAGGCGIGGKCGHGLFRNNCSDCSGWGGYARSTFSNVRCRILPFCHRSKSCESSCDSGCDGCGSTSGVIGAATLAPSDVQQTSYPRTER